MKQGISLCLVLLVRVGLAWHSSAGLHGQMIPQSCALGTLQAKMLDCVHIAEDYAVPGTFSAAGGPWAWAGCARVCHQLL